MDDVLTSAQAIELVGRTTMRRHLRNGTWQRPRRGVVVTHNGPLTPDQQERVVLAACPAGSAFAGLTAARRGGLQGFAPPRVSVVLPPGGERPPGDIEVHRSSELSSADVPSHLTPRRTTLERSVLDAASWSDHQRRARVLVIAAFQQRLTNVRRMREALSRRGPCRHRALIKESILDAAGGIQSLPERDFDDLRRRAGLPCPTRQERVKGPHGRYHLDAWWKQFNLAVEVHGIPHQAIEQWSDDLHRTNELVIDGRRVLAFSSFAIRREADVVIDQLQRARHYRGHHDSR